jgi:5-methyltetrahydrofolate--homocysteine methyltransferase
VAEELLQARGVHGFWSAAAEGDDVVLTTGNGAVRFPDAPPAGRHDDSRPNRSLADFVAPVETGLHDHIGGFAVGIHGADELGRVVRG